MQLSWGTKVGLAAAGLVMSLFFIPIPTNLHQVSNENILVGWQGRYDALSHQYYCRFLLSGGRYTDIRIDRFSRRWLVHRGSREFWTTRSNAVGVLQAAYRFNPTAVEQDLGTRANVFSPSTPFPASPVAYTASVINAMSRMRFNPQTVGGPNIPPDRVPVARLPGHLLQIDTLVNDSQLRQLSPGRTPRPLAALWRHGTAFHG